MDPRPNSNPALRRSVLFLFVLIAVTTSVAAASAQDRGHGYSVVLEDDAGRPLRTFSHRGERFVLGTMGERYNIRVRNHTGRRVEAVVTVDGRDVLTGDVGEFVRARGYVIEPYGSVRIEGFRQSFERVAAFRFSRPGQSYSSRMGTPENVGVIGVALFPEREPPRRAAIARPAPAPYEGGSSRGREAPSGRGEAKRGAAPSAPSSSAEASADIGRLGAPRDNLGTAYGESRESAIREVRFVRANATRPTALLTLRYDDREGLLARGIEVDGPRPRPMPHHPDPFPRRFAPPPPGPAYTYCE